MMCQQTEKEFLEEYDIRAFDRPSLAADIVLLSLLRDKPDADIKNINVHALQILLIKRASHPFMDRWALPGGFCKPSETVYETTKRELMEETNITNAYLSLKGVYSDAGRDPRGWIISNAWLGLVDRYRCQLRADTDAWDARWFTIQSLETTVISRTDTSTSYCHTLTLFDEETKETITSSIREMVRLDEDTNEVTYENQSSDLAFDHGQIIIRTVLDFRKGIYEDIRPLFYLLPDKFTIGEAQAAYEIITGKPTQNFRRKITKYVTETDVMDESRGFRPAKLFKKKSEEFIGNKR